MNAATRARRNSGGSRATVGTAWSYAARLSSGDIRHCNAMACWDAAVLPLLSLLHRRSGTTRPARRYRSRLPPCATANEI